MNPKLFVQAIKLVVAQHAAKAVLGQLESPSGRQPPEEVEKRSERFHAFNDEEKKFIEQVVSISAEQAAYNFLCVLDGISFIEDDIKKGLLQLYYVKDGKSALLNSEEDIELTSLYKSIK